MYIIKMVIPCNNFTTVHSWQRPVNMPTILMTEFEINCFQLGYKDMSCTYARNRYSAGSANGVIMNPKHISHMPCWIITVIMQFTLSPLMRLVSMACRKCEILRCTYTSGRSVWQYTHVSWMMQLTTYCNWKLLFLILSPPILLPLIFFHVAFLLVNFTVKRCVWKKSVAYHFL